MTDYFEVWWEQTIADFIMGIIIAGIGMGIIGTILMYVWVRGKIRSWRKRRKKRRGTRNEEAQ